MHQIPKSEIQTNCEKKSLNSFSSAANVVLSTVKMKQSMERKDKASKIEKLRQTEENLLSTCGDNFNSKV